MEKRNRHDKHPDPPKHDDDCEPKKPRTMVWPFSTIYGLVNKLFHLAKDILNLLIDFRAETERRLHRIEKQTKHLSILLPTLETLAVTQQRIEKKVDKMAIDLTKANQGLDALNASFTEIVAEFAALKDQINDPASQAAVDAFGDKLTALGQAFKDINPDTVPEPVPSSRRR